MLAREGTLMVPTNATITAGKVVRGHGPGTPRSGSRWWLLERAVCRFAQAEDGASCDIAGRATKERDGKFQSDGGHVFIRIRAKTTSSPNEAEESLDDMNAALACWRGIHRFGGHYGRTIELLSKQNNRSSVFAMWNALGVVAQAIILVSWRKLPHQTLVLSFPVFSAL